MTLPPPPTLIAACSATRAAIVEAVPPEYPQSARDDRAGAAGVTVRVIVGPDGRAASETVVVSSGRHDFDDAAIRAAAASTYSPQRFACIALTGSYDYTVTFDPQQDRQLPVATSCTQENRAARVAILAPRLYPDAARDLGIGAASVFVDATVDRNGRAESVTIARSSGNAMIDREAIRTAMRSSYVPAMDGCRTVEGTATFRIDFVP